MYICISEGMVLYDGCMLASSSIILNFWPACKLMHFWRKSLDLVVVSNVTKEQHFSTILLNLYST